MGGIALALGGAFLFATLLELGIREATRKPGRHTARRVPRQHPAAACAGPRAGVQAPPVLRAHESVALTWPALAEGLAAQQLKEWGP